MKRVLLVAFTGLLVSCTASPPTAVRPFPDHDQWILLEDLEYHIGQSGVTLTVPAGFVTDYASIPRGFWGIASPHDRYSEAAVVHDYLYWTQSCTRQQADNIFLIAMKEAGVSALRGWFIHMSVRSAGQGPWDVNAREFSAGLPRQVPKAQTKLTATDKWSELRVHLAEEGVHDRPTPKNLAYCVLGNSEDVPKAPAILSNHAQR